jgi:hypothetical protein
MKKGDKDKGPQRQGDDTSYKNDEAVAVHTEAEDACSKRVDNNPKNVKKSKLSSHPHLLQILNLPKQYALSIASRPTIHLATALILSIALCIVVATKGNPHFDAPGVGWFSKGTTVANRAAQEGVIRRWVGTSHNIIAEDKDKEGDDLYCSGAWYGSEEMLHPESINLVNMWKISDLSEKMSESALDANALYEMCIAEEHTLNTLAENDLCHKCLVEKKTWPWSTGSTTEEEEEKCIQPYSLVGLARVYMRAQYGFKSLGTEHILPSMSCERLKSVWSARVQKEFKEVLLECTSYMLEELQLTPATNLEYSSCKDFPMMTASLVDDQFLDTGRVTYTSSIFATKNNPASVKLMYNAEKGKLLQNPLKSEEYSSSSFEDNFFDVGINTLYATSKQGFYEMYLEGRLPVDVAILGASLIVTVVCVLIHTRSPFLTIMGVLQILLTLPLGYFVYYFICGVTL